jgi:hypothetical protein
MAVVAVSISDAVKRSTPPFVEASIHAWIEINGGETSRHRKYAPTE